MITTKIDGYTVDVDPDMGDGASGCWVSVKARGETFNSSLAALEAVGFLEAAGGETWAVPAPTIEKITAWATNNGY